MSSSTTTDDKTDLSTLRTRFEKDLQSFAQDATSTFRILHTVPSSSPGTSTTNLPSSSLTSTSNPTPPPSTLYVLDSSFNPPTKAHLTIARNAILNDRHARRPGPIRMLFLLATENADKKPKPASFEDRLVMMGVCAASLRESLADASPDLPSNESTANPDAYDNDLQIDIAVTKHPFFMDKALSIDSSGIYGSNEGKATQQVHLTGYDTLIRIFNSKYYPPDKKLRVLEPFLDKHRVRVCYRVASSSSSSQQQSSEERERDRREQEAYVEGIGDGSREDEGMKREWRGMVELVDDAGEVEGVSSTDARQASVEGDVKILKELVGEKVAQYIMGRRLYEGGDSVRKSYD